MLAAESRSHIGCEYWPTVSANARYVPDGSFDFDFAVAVANLSPVHVAHVEITGGALEIPRRFEVRPHGVRIEPLPWVEKLAYPDDRPVLAPDAAYRLVSSRPVVVYQFNPLQYQNDEKISASNDASLIFPSPAQGISYYVASYPYQFGSGFVVITATVDDT